MQIAGTRSLSPEAEELAARQEELAGLESKLADEELLLASLKAEIAAFEGLFLRRVGVLYAEIDEWTARLAELRRDNAVTPEAGGGAAEARARAEESYSAAHSDAARVQPFAPSAELRKLYRDAAKRVHPDTATDEKDRARHERQMKEVNAAYAAGDEEALRRVLTEFDNSPDAVEGAGAGADLVRVLRQLWQVRNRIAAIELEKGRLFETDIARLKTMADGAESEGRDLLAEIAATLEARVNALRREATAAGLKDGLIGRESRPAPCQAASAKTAGEESKPHPDEYSLAEQAAAILNGTSDRITSVAFRRERSGWRLKRARNLSDSVAPGCDRAPRQTAGATMRQRAFSKSRPRRFPVRTIVLVAALVVGALAGWNLHSRYDARMKAEQRQHLFEEQRRQQEERRERVKEEQLRQQEEACAERSAARRQNGAIGGGANRFPRILR